MANYHCLEDAQGDWRREVPALDRNIEDLIDRLIEGEIDLQAFRSEMSKYRTAIRVLQKCGKLSTYAKAQYEMIIGVVERHYKDDIDE